MRKIIISFFLLITSSLLYAQSSHSYDIIPQPSHLQKEEGFFKVGSSLKVLAPIDLEGSTAILKKSMTANKTKGKSSGKVQVTVDSKYIELGEEGYRLKVTSDGISISAAQKEGAIHGIFTLMQLQQIQKDPQYVPALEIIDTPRLSYRGMHLDVSRHFFPLSFIKKYIDMMALYKLNNFHWHLTDGQGWRLEIKKYPELTKKAAWRTNGNKLYWNLGKEQFLEEGDPNAYGGYYTQEEARELVKYAADRGIRVIPEIEFPAHSEEVTDVYPELACSGMRDGTPELCVCKDTVYTFMKNVLKEVMDIFPSQYIHIGGDEAPMTSWKDCEECKVLMKKQGFTKVDQLQSYAVKRIEQFLNDHGRRMIGWDEILKGGLAPNATVMSWRGESGGIAAARQHHDVIMTPSTYCYFDAYQSDPNTQPKAIGGFLPIDKVYSYNPVPKVLTKEQKKYILGVQANLWTEYIPTTYQVEYMVFPRLLALAEVGWTAQEDRSFDDFHRRLQSQYLLLQRHDVNYYRPSYRIQIVAKPDYEKKGFWISFPTEQYRPEIHYTTDGSTPNVTDSLYQKPFLVYGKTTIKAAIFKKSQQMDSVKSYTANYHKAIGKKVTYKKGGWSSSYPAQKKKTLTNGITGSPTYKDLQWQGFLHDMDVVVDMGKITDLKKLSMRFMQLIGPGVYIPNAVSVFLSQDGKNYQEAGTEENDVSPKDPRLLFKTFTFDLTGKKARYIRVKVKKQRGFMFTDEIIVE